MILLLDKNELYNVYTFFILYFMTNSTICAIYRKSSLQDLRNTS